MKNRILLCCALMLSSAVFAGGYRVALQGVRQAAMGAQGATLTHDASVAFYNPAGLAFVDSKFSVAVGGFGIIGHSKYQNTMTGETAETDNPLGTPVYFAASYKPTDNLAVGLSVTTPFGNAVKWGDAWSGRYLINEIELRSFFIQPTVAYKFTDWFSVGAGVIIARGNVNLQRNVAVLGQDAQLEIDATDASGTGFNVGAYLKPHEKVNVAIAYRSKVDMEVEGGDAFWRGVPALAGGNLPFTTDRFNATLPLVSETSIGINYQATPKLLLAAEVQANGWIEYRSLDLTFEDSNSGQSFESSSVRDYANTFNYVLGAEYQANDMLALRLGYKFDSSPSPAGYFSPETPTVDYHAFTGGVGLAFNGFNVDLMGEYLHGLERSFSNVETGFSGDLLTRSFIFGLGLSYNFGQTKKAEPANP